MDHQKLLILASSSPRRQEYIRLLDRPFLCENPEVSEEISGQMRPEEMVIELACRKAESVAAKHRKGVVIGADTVVVLEDEVLGKPLDEQDAKTMLQKLSGKKHQVFTGICVIDIEKHKKLCNYKRTEVKMAELQEEEIDWYLHTKEPMDKAGAYGIQGYGCTLVEGISGDYYNVMGLPVCRLAQILTGFGVDPLALAAQKEL